MQKIINLGNRELKSMKENEILEFAQGMFASVKGIIVTSAEKIEELENAIVIKVNIMENKIYAWSYILKIVDKEYSVYEEKEPEGSKDWFKNLTNLESINFFTSRGFAVEVQGI